MAGYRLYCLDEAEKVVPAEWIDADDDDAAVEVAKDMMDGRSYELRKRTRLIARSVHG